MRPAAAAAQVATTQGATTATSRAEREMGLAMIERQDPGCQRRITLGGDKGFDTREFVEGCRALCVTPHVAAKIAHSSIDARTSAQDIQAS